MNVKFLYFWEHFSVAGILYINEGTHLNSIWNARLRRLLDKGDRKLYREQVIKIRQILRNL